MKTFFAQKRNLTVLIVWAVLTLAVLGGMIWNIVAYTNGSLDKAMFNHRLLFVFSCIGCMSAVYLVELIFHIRLPLYLELACTIFSFAGLAGGTVFGLYGVFSAYDKVLHTTSGVLFAIMGLALATLLLKGMPDGKQRVLVAVAIAFFFSLTVGYLWELYEFTLDTIFKMNNQRWAMGVYPIDVGDGTYIVGNMRGTAIVDTMGDMIVHLFGTLAVLITTLIVCLKKTSRLNAFNVEIIKRKNREQPEPPQTE